METAKEVIEKPGKNPLLELITPKNVGIVTGVVAALTAVRAANHWATKNSQGKIVAPEELNLAPDQKVVIFVNGLGYDTSKFLDRLNHLQGFMGEDTSVYGYCNLSTSPAHDWVQSRVQVLAGRKNKLPHITKAMSSELADFIQRCAETGARVIVLGHSQGCCFTSEAAQILDRNRSTRHVLDRVAFISTGSPLPSHYADSWYGHGGIMNSEDPIQKHNPKPKHTINVSTPADGIPKGDGAHHSSKSGYFVPGSIIGEAITALMDEAFSALV